MAILKTSRMFRIAISTWGRKGSSCDYIPLSVVLSYEVPEVIILDVLVIMVYKWRTIEGSNAKRHPATNDVLVVAVELGESFFH
jgi:hypothetical protein